MLPEAPGGYAPGCSRSRLEPPHATKRRPGGPPDAPGRSRTVLAASQTLPDAPGRSQTFPDAAGRSRTVPEPPGGSPCDRKDAPEALQTLPDAPGRSRKLPRRSRTFSDVPGRSRTLPDAPGRSWTVPEPPGVSPCDKKKTPRRPPRRSRTLPDGPGSFPDVPGRSQTLLDGPGAARRLPMRPKRRPGNPRSRKESWPAPHLAADFVFDNVVPHFFCTAARPSFHFPKP